MSTVDTLVAMGAPMNPRRMGSGPQTASMKYQAKREILWDVYTKKIV